MQRVKAHELRLKDETGLVGELTKFRVSSNVADVIRRKNSLNSE